MDYIELYNLMKNRRSIRKWANDAIPDNLLRKIAETGIYAPSAANTQKIKIEIIKDKSLIKCVCSNTSDWFRNITPNAILGVYFDLSKEDTLHINYIKPHHYWYRFIWQDSAASMMNMLLMAEALDLGACWVSMRQDRPVHEEAVRYTLDIPDHYIVTSFLFLGYSMDNVDYDTAKHQGMKIRRDIDGSIIERD